MLTVLCIFHLLLCMQKVPMESSGTSLFSFKFFLQPVAKMLLFGAGRNHMLLLPILLPLTLKSTSMGEQGMHSFICLMKE